MLTRTSEYALRALIYLTQNESDWPISGRTIAENAGIPAKYLSKILGDLVKCGVLQSFPGKTGGVQPSKPPNKTMLRDVLAPFEQFENRRCPFGSLECSDDHPCLAHNRWKHVVGSQDRFLRVTSVYDVAVPMPGSQSEGECRGMNEANEMPTAVLRSEHKVILRVIEVLKRLVARAKSGEGFEKHCLSRCVTFFQLFADACHHAKEEDLLFPALEYRGMPRDGGPIGCMLEEHRAAREFTRLMAEALEADEEDAFCSAAKQYADLLTQHIQKEDTVLFTLGDNVLTGDDQESLCGKFCDVGCGTFGGKKQTELAAMADELESRWPAT